MGVRSEGFNLVAGEAMAQYRVVKLSSTAGQCLMADAADYAAAIGVVEDAPLELNASGVIPSGTQVRVVPLFGGVRRVMAAGNITAGAQFKLTADGEIVALGTSATEAAMGRVIGACADGTIAECVFTPAVSVLDLS